MMTKKVAFVFVKYDEFSPETYEGVYVREKGGDILKEENSGNFEEDYQEIKNWAEDFDGFVFCTSSVDHYMIDSSKQPE